MVFNLYKYVSSQIKRVSSTYPMSIPPWSDLPKRYAQKTQATKGQEDIGGRRQ